MQICKKIQLWQWAAQSIVEVWLHWQRQAKLAEAGDTESVLLSEGDVQVPSPPDYFGWLALMNFPFLKVVFWPWKIWLLGRGGAEIIAPLFWGLTKSHYRIVGWKRLMKCPQTFHTTTIVHPGAGLFPHLVQWGSQWGLDPSPSPPLHSDGKTAGWHNNQDLIQSTISPFLTYFRRTGWEGLLQLCTRSCASCGALISDQRCSFWPNASFTLIDRDAHI